MSFKTAKVFLGLVALTSMVGCEDFTGKMNVYSEFSIQNHHILHRSATYSAGEYDLKLRYHTVEGLLEFDSPGHKEVKIKVPKSTLKTDGTISLLGTDIGEDFNVQGTLATQQAQSASYKTYQVCDAGYFVDGFGALVPVTGNQLVMAHNLTTTHSLNLAVVSPNPSLPKIADVTTANQDVQEIIESVLGPCI